MNIKQKVLCCAMIVVGLLFLFSSVRATTATTLTLSNTTGDRVQTTITGAPNSSIQLSFLPPGSSAVSAIVFGTTDASGNFSTSISSGGYGIPQGSPVFVTINGVQSLMMLWPAYTASLSFSQTSVAVAVGQSAVVSASNSLILASNSAPTIFSTSISGSQLTVTGLANGSGTLILCAANVGCKSIPVEVGGQSGQSQVSFDQNNVVLYVGDAKSVAIVSGSHNGFTLSSNSNPAVLHTSLVRTMDIVWLYGDAPGTATLSICSVDSGTNCANLSITVLSKAATALSFSQNNILLTPGLTQTATVSGGQSDSYYISSNSNSGVVTATLSGNIVTVVGGTNAASAVITVCSTVVNNTCGSLNVTLTNTSAVTPSATVLAFSQNVVSITQGDTTNVTVTGGTGTGYLISSNSSPGVVTASINGNSNVVALYGNTLGSTIITVCSASVGTTCASLYVTVNAALPPIILSQNNTSLISGGSVLVTVNGGSANNTIYSNSNSNVVSASMTSNSKMVLLKGGTISGTSSIIICPSATQNSQCATINAVNVATNVLPVVASPVAGDLVRASSAAIYYLGADGKRYVFPNEKTYKTWYADFSGVKTITDAKLASYPIGGNVTYKPGLKMVKVTTDPRVYAVDARNNLREIASEAVAKALYGASWAKLVEDIPDAFFVNYTIGSHINSASDFKPDTVRASAISINSDKGLN